MKYNISLCKIKEFLGLFLLICLIYLGYQIHKYRSNVQNMIESYEDYDKNVQTQKAEALKLSETQTSEV